MSKTSNDGWMSAATGLGVRGVDKSLDVTFGLRLLTQESAEQLWRGDAMAARCVETVPDEMLREGFEVCIDEADSKEISEAADAEHRRLNTTEQLRKALYYANAFGGAGILLGADDGATDLSLPLVEDRIKTFDWMTVLSPNELLAQRYYGDPAQPKYGEVELYRLQPMFVNPDGSPPPPRTIHESRIVRVPGIEVTRQALSQAANNGWGDSIFLRIAQTIADFQNAYRGVAILVSDFAPAVLKLKNLDELLSAEGEDMLRNRVRALELCRSIARAAIVDAELEDYKRESTNVAGLPDLLDKLAQKLASDIRMPVTLLMGEAPAGLNATGAADARWFYDQVSSLQERRARPALKRITEVIFKNRSGPNGGKVPENWDVRFSPLWQPTELEQTQVRKLQAEIDTAYINAQVVTPEEIAESRFGGDEYSTETKIDLDSREEIDQATRLGQPDEHDARMKEAQTQAAEKAARTAPEA